MKSFTKRRVEVSLFPLVVLLGIACGLMFCAFLLGYSTGNKVGFSEAREASLKRMAKFPIDEVINQDMTRKERVDAYLKLENDTSFEKENLKKAKKQKRLETKKTNKDKKENILLNDLLVKKKNKGSLAKENRKEEVSEKTETIGSLIAKKNNESEKTKPKIQLVKEKESKKIEILKEVEKDSQVKNIPKVDSKKVVKSSYLVKNVAPGWYAQVAAPTSINEANVLANKLHSSGFRLVIEKAEINGNTYFRVLVGSEKNKTQAVRLVEQLAREPYIDSTPFVRRMS